MTDVEFIWDEGPGGNVEHLADNGLTPEDVIHALETVTEFAISRSSGRSAFYGYALDGRFKHPDKRFPTKLTSHGAGAGSAACSAGRQDLCPGTYFRGLRRDCRGDTVRRYGL